MPRARYVRRLDGERDKTKLFKCDELLNAKMCGACQTTDLHEAGMGLRRLGWRGREISADSRPK